MIDEPEVSSVREVSPVVFYGRNSHGKVLDLRPTELPKVIQSDMETSLTTSTSFPEEEHQQESHPSTQTNSPDLTQSETTEDQETTEETTTQQEESSLVE